ncbi:hypothetical protein D9M71_216080 [compost metagenome]
MESDDDRRLDLCRQEAAQTDAGHALEQYLAIVGIALVASGQAAFFVVLQQGLMQGRDDVGRRGEAPLAGLGHVGELVVQIHGQGMRVALGGGQRLLVGKHEAHARHALQALAGCSDQGVERHLAGVNRQGAEGTHGVDDQALAVLGNDLGDLWQRIEDAGTGFAMNQRHMGDAAVGAQQAVDIGGGGGLVFSGFEGAVCTPQHFADLGQALAVGAVDQHQDLAVAGDQRADGCFHGEGAAALQGNAMVAGSTVDDGQQLLADTGGQLVEGVIPRPPIHQHRLPSAQRSGQWARGQQDRGSSTHSGFLTSDGLNVRGLSCNLPCYQSNCLSLCQP